MTLTSIGDMSRSFMTLRNGGQIRQRLETLSQEMSTGRVKDLTAHLDRDAGRVTELDRGIGLAESFETATQQTEQMLGTMQLALGTIDSSREHMFEQLSAMQGQGTLNGLNSAANAAQQGFEATVSALNSRFGDTALFSGTATDRSALASAGDMLASITAALGPAVTATDVADAVDAWFDDPAGGFRTGDGYLGEPGAPLTRRVSQDRSITIDARAEDPALTAILKAAALAVIAGDEAVALPDSTRLALVEQASERMISAAQPLTEMRARLGEGEAEAERMNAFHAARGSALTMMRNDLALADPYDTASNLQATQARLEQHFIVTARLSQLSLAGYLR
ncbi:hypothetical protein [Pseudoroseicyclus aestuarii]|uniref:Flagellar hook-associated protein 3 FlgL n=1 Tax=Pseudoroseicyclus aestuarii TaxID=1795041 RepID=A0A318T897_9RHOB|nr:hypothetical protein [Pseudoroseicyclus aestuarii]PYE84608.1 flagellar hook-associated protein 3 FlgL [Pseudoroseicyclus aestuarii]